MACEIERPDPQILFNRYKQMFSNTVLGGAEVIPESNEWYAVAIQYAAAEEFWSISQQAWRERDPRTACCENLIDMASVDGVFPKPAVFAQGYVKLTGDSKAGLPNSISVTVGDQTFVSANPGKVAKLDNNGEAVIRVRATTPGEAGNLVGATGNLASDIDGVNTQVEVCGGTFCNGQEAEGCEAFRQRYLQRLQYQPRATQAWILDKFLEWPCLTRAVPRAGSCCRCNDDCGEECGCKECGGDLSFYVMFDESFPNGIAPQSIIEEVQEWMFGTPQGYGLGQVELGVCGRVHAVTGVPVTVLVDLNACVSNSSVQTVKDYIADYFTTVGPSEPVKLSTLNATVAAVIGADQDFSVSLVLDDQEQGYSFLQARTDKSVVFTGCDMEPDCDYLLTLSSVRVNKNGAGVGGCS